MSAPSWTVLRGAGDLCKKPFRCRGGCLESAADGWRCQPVGTPRHAVKMPQDWAPSCGGPLENNIAEFCPKCIGQVAEIKASYMALKAMVNGDDIDAAVGADMLDGDGEV